MFSKKQEIIGHSAAVYSLIADAEFVYSGSADNYVARWLTSTGEQDKFAIKFEQSVYALEFFGDNLLAVGLADGGLHIFDLEKRTELKYFTQHTKAIFSIAYNAPKKQLYVSDAEGNLSVWNANSLELLIYIPFDCGKIRSMAVSSTGDHFVLACQDGNLRTLETEFFNEIQTINAHKDGGASVLFHPTNEDLLISGGKDALIKIWKWKEELLVETIVAHNYAVYDLLSIHDGKQFVSASRDKTIKVWNSSDFSFVQRLESKNGGHRHSVNALAKIDEESFVSCSDDKRIIVWSGAE